MLSERNQSLATLSESRAGEKVADAMARGYLSPAMKPWALALCRSNEASFDAFVASTVPPLAHLAQSHGYMRTAPATGQSPVAQSDEAAIVCRQLGLAPGALND